MWTTFKSVFRKELLHILRDAGTLRLVVTLPVMQLILFGFIDQTVHDLPTVIVDQDRSNESRALIDALVATKTFAVMRVTDSPEEARELIRAGRARLGVLIPPRYRDRRAHRESANVLALI